MCQGCVDTPMVYTTLRPWRRSPKRETTSPARPEEPWPKAAAQTMLKKAARNDTLRQLAPLSCHQRPQWRVSRGRGPDHGATGAGSTAAATVAELTVEATTGEAVMEAGTAAATTAMPVVATLGVRQHQWGHQRHPRRGPTAGEHGPGPTVLAFLDDE
ncbi:hypothetical protein MTO96_004227 [Rhipicephalus appendiculatus]